MPESDANAHHDALSIIRRLVALLVVELSEGNMTLSLLVVSADDLVRLSLANEVTARFENPP